MSIRNVIIGVCASMAELLFDTPEYVSSGTYVYDSNIITIPPPDSYIDGDLLVLAITTPNSDVDATSLSAITGDGWTQFSSVPIGTGSSGALNSTKLDLYYKIASGTQSSIGVETVSLGHLATGRMVAFRKVDSVSPIQAVANTAVATAGTTHTFPTITTTSNNALIAMFSGIGRDVDDSVNYTAATNASLSNIAIIFSQTVSNTTSGGGLGLVTGLKSTSGSVGTTAVTTDSAKGALVTSAIAPSSGYSLDRVIGVKGSISKTVLDASSNVIMTLEANGATTISADTGSLTDWYGTITAGIGSSYYVRATTIANTGSATLGGTVGSWSQLNTPRTWYLLDTTDLDFATWDLKFEFSPNSSGVPVVATSKVMLTADSSPTPTVSPTVSPTVATVEPVVSPAPG